jgi:hypothetical protein
VGDRVSGFANGGQRLLRALRRYAEGGVIGHGAAPCEIGQWLVGPAQWLPQAEDRRHDHIAGTGNAAHQARIGVQLLLGFANEAQQLFARAIPQIVQERPADGRAVDVASHFAQQGQPPVRLGLEEESGVSHRARLGCAELVDQLGMNISWPRPATNVGDAVVVDRDDSDLVAGETIRIGAGQVVEAPLQPAEQVGGGVQRKHRHHDAQAHHGIGSPDPAKALFRFRFAAGHVSHFPG